MELETLLKVGEMAWTGIDTGCMKLRCRGFLHICPLCFYEGGNKEGEESIIQTYN